MTQEFIRERQYLKAVSPHTIIGYDLNPPLTTAGALQPNLQRVPALLPAERALRKWERYLPSSFFACEMRITPTNQSGIKQAMSTTKIAAETRTPVFQHKIIKPISPAMSIRKNDISSVPIVRFCFGFMVELF